MVEMPLVRLFLAALLEAGGDALVRAGLRSPGASRIGLLLSGALALFAYGCTVNAPQWTFGRLLGVYLAFFFLVGQVIGWLAFHETPNRAVLVGGACIVLGGIIITVWQP
jgi:small multidrug resistance family-3 protein